MVNQMLADENRNLHPLVMHHDNPSFYPGIFCLFIIALERQVPDRNPNHYEKFPSDSADSTRINSNTLKVSLEDSDLWQVFNQHVNEMIVTRTGRRLFPVYKIKIEGLDPNEMYKFELDFQLVESFRWKYVGGEWLKSSRSDVLSTSGVYTHPDSPNYGKFWMHSVVSFSRAKITNRDQSNSEAVRAYND
ncbi:T-box-containing protein TBXT [Thelohanellus kitauei]|uniref:T-box-containing protein TBXT n=1 Tax=Thelohanellus kitauei TaxID=669202 RepID=A0A0C2JJT3_THEKT|nr:T-box-containing protein TBXT [Thelohanellus kitauei]